MQRTIKYYGPNRHKLRVNATSLQYHRRYDQNTVKTLTIDKMQRRHRSVSI